MTDSKLSAKSLNDIMVALGHLCEPPSALSLAALAANFISPDASFDEVLSLIQGKDLIPTNLEAAVAKIIFSIANNKNELGVELQQVRGTGGVPTPSEIDLKGQKVSTPQAVVLDLYETFAVKGKAPIGSPLAPVVNAFAAVFRVFFEPVDYGTPSAVNEAVNKTATRLGIEDTEALLYASNTVLEALKVSVLKWGSVDRSPKEIGSIHECFERAARCKTAASAPKRFPPKPPKP